MNVCLHDQIHSWYPWVIDMTNPFDDCARCHFSLPSLFIFVCCSFEHFVRHIFFYQWLCVFFFLSILFILFAIVLTPFLRLLITIYHNCFSVSFICCYVVLCFLWVKIEFTVCMCMCVCWFFCAPFCALYVLRYLSCFCIWCALK